MSAVAFDIVREVVMAKRREGLKASFAVLDAANDLGVSPRWITSVLRNEPHAIKPGRLAVLRTRFTAWLAADIEKSEQIVAERRARLASMEADIAVAMDTNSSVAGLATRQARRQGSR